MQEDTSACHCFRPLGSVIHTLFRTLQSLCICVVHNVVSVLLEVREIHSILAHHVLPSTILMDPCPRVEGWVRQDVLYVAIRRPVNTLLIMKVLLIPQGMPA